MIYGSLLIKLPITCHSVIEHLCLYTESHLIGESFFFFFFFTESPIQKNIKVALPTTAGHKTCGKSGSVPHKAIL